MVKLCQASWLLLWFVGAGVGAAAPTTAGPTVRGNTDCPTPGAVRDALTGLMPAGRSDDPTAETVELRARGDAITMTLSSSNGVLATRELPARASSCAERARAAAVIIAAWEVHFGSRLRGDLADLTRPAETSVSTPPAAPPAATEPPRPAVTEPPPPAPTSSAASVASVVGAAGVPPAPRPPLDVQTGAAALLSLSGGTASPGVLVEATFARRGAPFGVGVVGLAIGPHSTAVATGEGTSRRLGGVLDLRSIVSGRLIAGELHGGVALTALTVQGRAFPIAAPTATVFDPGLLVAVRARLMGQRLTPWLQLSAAVWPRAHTLTVSGLPTTADLSPYEILLCAGMSLGPAP